MPRYICKVVSDGEPLYFEWSTVVDAPVTSGMTRGQFETYYREEYGRTGMEGLDERMGRVERNGTSAVDGETVESLLRHNRAGPGETEATFEEIIKGLEEGRY